MEDAGKITAICVTSKHRLGLLDRAVGSFLAQSYENKRLLIIPEDKEHADAIHNSIGGALPMEVMPQIDVMGPPYSGDLVERFTRGLDTVQISGGDFFTFWDDDNESHRQRLTRQIAACRPGRPSFLSGALWHYFDSSELFAIDFEERYKDLWSRVVHASLVASVEDLRTIHAPKALKKTKNPGTGISRTLFDRSGDAIARATNEWWWMKFGVRGDNLNTYDAHRRLASDNKRCQTAQQLKERRVWLDSLLAGYSWDGPVDVCGVDGIAYTYIPTATRCGFLPIGHAPGVERITEEA